MQGFASFVQHRAVSDLLGEGVLKKIFHLGERRLLVEKLLALERGEETIQLILRLRNSPYAIRAKKG
jgi:hypothetical protein